MKVFQNLELFRIINNKSGNSTLYIVVIFIIVNQCLQYCTLIDSFCTSALREMYLRGKVGGAADYLRAGDRMNNAALGYTLQKIANDSYTFYNGSLASDIVADVFEQGICEKICHIKIN